MFLKKSFETEQQHTDPQAEDLALIRRFAQRDVKADEVWTGRQSLANDQYDRAHERFPVEYLERFAETLPGKAVMGGHDYDTLPLGRYYAASVQKGDHGYYLQADYYLRADSPLVPSIELGILKDVSVGYNAGRRVCDLCEKSWSPYGAKDGCEHWPGADFDGKTCTLTYCPTEAHKAEAMEGSFVWAGCQYGAEAVPKAMGAALNHALIEQIIGLPGSERLQWMLAREGAKSMPTIEEVQAELQQTKAQYENEYSLWRKEQAELKKQAADGEWGRKHLADEIVRMAGAVKRTETYAVILKALGETPSVEQLLPIYEEIGKEFDATFSTGRAHTDGPPAPDEKHQSIPAHQRRRLSWVR